MITKKVVYIYIWILYLDMPNTIILVILCVVMGIPFRFSEVSECLGFPWIMMFLDCRFLWRCLSQIPCVRRLLGNFDAKVSDSAQLANYARSLLGQEGFVCRKFASSRSSSSMKGCANPWFHDLYERCIFRLMCRMRS